MRNLIVIPAFNEEAALPRAIAALQVLPAEYELLVVNDGSKDATGTVAETLAAGSRLKLHVVHLSANSGIGAAVQTGYKFAARDGGYDYVIQYDADGQHDANGVLKLVQTCAAQQLDLCIGSRFLNGADVETFRSTRLRRVGIRFFSRLISLLTATKITDPTSGFRCAGPRAWQQFAKHYPDDFPEPESLFWSIRNRLRVGEVSVRMHERRDGVTSIRFWRSLYYMIKVTLAILVENVRHKEPVTP